MRVAVDVRYLSHGLVGGVHTYTRDLLAAILQADSANEYVLWADRKAPFELDRLPENADLRTLPWSSPFSSVRNDRRIGRAMVRGGADLAHFPANFGFAPGWLPRVITLHDAINLLPLSEIVRGHRKDPRTLLMMGYLHEMTTRALAGAPTVITVSEHSRAEILRRSSLPAENVRVVHSAPHPTFRVVPPAESEELRRRLGARDSVILADAIKNPATTLRAYRDLRPELRDRTSLVWFARRRPDEAVVASHASGESILVTRPPQDELVRLYNLADVFVFPSWYEGFGLPVLEAMACGATVVTSDRGSLPEVAGDAALVTGADDHRAIAGALTRVLTDDAYRARLRSAGLAWSARFTWAAAAQSVVAIYEDAYRRAVSPSNAVRLAAI